MNAFDILKERGFFENSNAPEELRELLSKEKVTFYMGFDATADSLTIGHYFQFFTIRHLQRAGHKPIILLGGGTTSIGDPSGRNDMRKLMDDDFIDNNVASFKEQMSRFIDFTDDKAVLLNNKEWVKNLNFLDFMRDIAVHFNVNRMLSYECYKNRMTQGLTFFEMAYMLLQAYDFYYLYKNYDCVLQAGGSDQWANMLSGCELIEKKLNKKAYVITTSLITKSDGEKMGKTSKGALWLDKKKTSPFELFQYFRNIEDTSVIKLLKCLTFLDIEKINEMAEWKDKEINKAKEILAYEIVKDIHGEEEAEKALETSRALFVQGSVSENMPTSHMDRKIFEEGIGLLNLLMELNMVSSKSEARTLTEQGGISINDNKISDVKKIVNLDDFSDNYIVIKKGKKTYRKVEI